MVFHANNVLERVKVRCKVDDAVFGLKHQVKHQRCVYDLVRS